MRKPRDASWLIGPVLIIPALLYLSFWATVNMRFLQGAYIVPAHIIDVEYRRSARSGEYITHFEFKDAQDNVLPGFAYGNQPETRVGQLINMYYNPAFEDLRFCGAFGVWAGLTISLGVTALGLLLGVIAYYSSGSAVQDNPDELFSL